MFLHTLSYPPFPLSNLSHYLLAYPFPPLPFSPSSLFSPFPFVPITYLAFSYIAYDAGREIRHAPCHWHHTYQLQIFSAFMPNRPEDPESDTYQTIVPRSEQLGKAEVYGGSTLFFWFLQSLQISLAFLESCFKSNFCGPSQSWHT